MSYNNYLVGLIKNIPMTQQQFSRRLGIHNSTLSNIINGRRGKHTKHKALIADYFNKPIKKIFNRG